MKLLLVFVVQLVICNAHVHWQSTDSNTERSTFQENVETSTREAEVFTTDEGRYRTSEGLRPRTSTWPHHHTTDDTRRQCDSLFVQYPRNETLRPGDNVTYTCSCLTYDPYHPCPVWSNLYDLYHVVHAKRSSRRCDVTVQIKNVNYGIKSPLECQDVWSDLKDHVHLSVIRSDYGEICEINGDCNDPLQTCQNGKCYCHPERPVYVTGRCYQVRKLLTSCENSVQCKALDTNAYCLRSDVNGTGGKYCLCGPGYERANDGQCVCDDCGVKYVYRFTKRYQNVFYALMGISILLILIGLVRLCMIQKRAAATMRRVSNRSEFTNPLTDPEQQNSSRTDPEQQKEKF